ncbi:CST complex subunit CTC1 [Anomaloglossus baeobatrachus]|uniref:CST complex subunit CTC1 n=1 Tax=Anomaloglossus baeobatrachus TaxID=238106 RepID=UPI003F505948
METQGAQETSWLEAAERHIQEHLRGGEAEKELVTSVWLQCTRLPVSYSFTAISQLLALQRSPCVSLLGWGTEQFLQWSREGLGRRTESGGAPPTTLPRARLLLAGYITDLPDDGNREQDGNLYIQDASGCVPCEISQFDCSGLGSLYFFPCWTFIPTHQTGGYVEVLSPPIPVPKVHALVPVNSSLLTPVSAFLLLGDSSHPRGFRVAVIGKLSSVTSLVTIRSKTFFFFFLQHGKRTIPVIVHVPSKLFWFRVLAVGETYEVSSLSLSSLGGSPRRVFAVTSSSILALRPPLSPPFLSTPDMDNSEELTEPGESLAPDCGPQERVTGRRSKEAKTLTYKGVVTRVLNAPAGLYELDGALLLCTAYTQLQNGGRGMRVGARVEVCDSHLQQTPSPLFPSLVLSCCLRSRIQICDFSRLTAPCALFSGSGNLYLQLLFRYRLRLPEFLWACDVINKLQEKLCPRFVRQNCVTRAPSDGAQGPAEKLLFPTISTWPDGRRERDLQEEMVAEPHDCPLRQYSPLPPPWSLPPLSLVPSLVSSTQKLPGEESNRRLHWSHHSVRSRDLSPPQVLLGVLQASSSSGSLILKDQSSSLSCLVLPAPPISWISTSPPGPGFIFAPSQCCHLPHRSTW